MMLQLFHKYQRYFTWLVLISAFSLAFTGFGYDLFSRKQTKEALRYRKQEVPLEQYYERLRELERRYRQMFGQNFDKLAAQFGLNLPQQLLDQTIGEFVMDDFANNLGLVAGTQEWKNTLQSEVFPSGFDLDRYREILRERGQSQEAFESDIKRDVVRKQLAQVLRDLSVGTTAEAKVLYARDNTTYGVRTVQLDPANFVSSVVAPKDEEIQAYYENNQAEFERPERVLYRYSVIRPEDVLAQVQVAPDEVEFTYTDKLDRYSNPEQVRARHIQLNFPAEKDAAKMAAVKARAEEILEKVKSGQNFDSLALEYSDDTTTKSLGGDLGWITRGMRAKEFDEQAFKNKAPGIAELVSTDYGYHIVKVDEYKPGKPKELSEVRAEIERELRERDAPSYASEKAQKIYDAWTKGKSSLSDVATKENLTISEGGELRDESSDPNPTLAGLTKAILSYGEEKQLLIELPKLSVLVEVVERRPVEYSPLSEVRGKIEANLRAAAARKSARIAAQDLLKEISTTEVNSLVKIAEKRGLKITEKKGLKSSSPPTDAPLSEPSVQSFIFEQDASAGVGGRPLAAKDFEVGGSAYIVQVFEASLPPESELNDSSKLETYRTKERVKIAQILEQSLVNSSKAKAAAEGELDINPAVLAAR